ncbi:MAG: alpha/beta hydrolase [Cyclobacteriaceae bacterium]
MPFIQYHNQTLFYSKQGNGNNALLLFHGFGQDHTAFDSWIKILEGSHTLYIFDLFYHGSSTRPNQPLSKSNWIDLIDAFLHQEGIEQFSIAGFSLGGRFALAMVQHFASRIKVALLLAPDGIYQNRWYIISTSWYGNWFFRHIMHHPDFFDKWNRFAKKLRLSNPSMLRFIDRVLGEEANRIKVYQSWTYFKPLGLDKRELTTLLNNSKSGQIQLYLGSKDRIIPKEQIIKKVNYQLIKTIDAKHHELIDKASRLTPQIFG